MTANLKSLIEKLNEPCRIAASRAANLCMAMGHYEIEIEHLFLALLEQERSDLSVIARRSGIGSELLGNALRAELQKLKCGNTRVPVFAHHVPLLLQQAWLLASLTPQQPPRIRSGQLLLALLTEPELAQVAERSTPLFRRFPLEELKHRMERCTEGSIESGSATEITAPLQDDATPALDQYTIDLTRQAREGKLDPVIGRDKEIRQMMDVLMRRRQNNPILTGDAGVGKTAVVEGLALRVAAGDVPDALHGIAIRALDMAQLQAGASVKGEYEQRLKSVITEVSKSTQPIVLFIDEAHMMIGAGGPAGQNDAANLLKPALARGELRTIAATTWSEYKKYFEKDAALARRFQVVTVDEPDETTACAMLRAMVPLMERHFGIRVRPDAVTEAVYLSRRYISGRQLPDKAVSVLDTACARVALAQCSAPADLEESAQHVRRIEEEICALERDERDYGAPSSAIAELRGQCAEARRQHAELAARWQREKNIADEIRRLRGLEQPPSQALREMEKELVQVQDSRPLIQLDVDGATVAGIVSGWTGIPLGKLQHDDIAAMLALEHQLGERVIGQPHAMESIARRLRTSSAGLEDPCKPKAVFLLAGPSGVGKTQTALALADLLYGGEHKLITINMSEYQEAHSVAGLKGSPPGYVGYGEGGVLTEAVRRNPYCVLLLDEIEKAHPAVVELLYQAVDRGLLEDAEGQLIDFRNVVVIATCNTGSAAIMQACLNKPVEELPTPDELQDLIRPQLMKHFRPAFIGRVQVLPYYPVSETALREIIAIKLRRVAARIADAHKADFRWQASLEDAIFARCTEADSGARNVDNMINGLLLPEIARLVLLRLAEGRSLPALEAGERDKVLYVEELS